MDWRCWIVTQQPLLVFMTTTWTFTSKGSSFLHLLNSPASGTRERTLLQRFPLGQKEWLALYGLEQEGTAMINLHNSFRHLLLEVRELAGQIFMAWLHGETDLWLECGSYSSGSDEPGSDTMWDLRALAVYVYEKPLKAKIRSWTSWIRGLMKLVWTWIRNKETLRD